MPMHPTDIALSLDKLEVRKQGLLAELELEKDFWHVFLAVIVSLLGDAGPLQSIERQTTRLREKLIEIDVEMTHLHHQLFAYHLATAFSPGAALVSPPGTGPIPASGPGLAPSPGTGPAPASGTAPAKRHPRRARRGRGKKRAAQP